MAKRERCYNCGKDIGNGWAKYLTKTSYSTARGSYGYSASDHKEPHCLWCYYSEKGVIGFIFWGIVLIFIIWAWLK
jgi:hypothetical protein